MRLSFTKALFGGLLFVSLFFSKNPVAAQVFINEYSAANLSQYADNFSEYEDWIELYNPGTASVDISGYYLSDNPNNPTKWKIPAPAIIGTGNSAYRIFFCSGRDTLIGLSMHTNFKLSQTTGNDMITLSDPQGIILDTIDVKKTKIGHSRGRTVDGVGAWAIFATPTYKKTNNTGISYNFYADRPDFDQKAGFYQDSVTVTMENNEPNSALRYTLDGTLPTSTSPLYTGPITLKSTAVVKAIAFSSDAKVLPSFVEYKTLFVNDKHSLVVVSISGNQLQNLANGNKNLIPHGSIEYFNKAGKRTADAYGTFNSHGQDSWVNDMRSLDLVVRDEAGYEDALNVNIFKRSERDKYQRIILRAGGDDSYPGNFLPQHKGCAHVRDAYIHNLADRGGLNMDLRRSEKAILYIDGKYWGVYDLRELPDDHDFTEYYHNQGKLDIQYILHWGNTWSEYGGAKAQQDWQKTQDFIMNNDMTDQANFDQAISELDATSLTDYVIANSLTVCSDWLNWNTGWWRGLNPEGGHRRWGFILWDNDATFGYYINYTGIPDTSATALPCNADNLDETQLNIDPEHWYVFNDTVTWQGMTYYPGDSLFIEADTSYSNPDDNGHLAMLKKLRTNAAFDLYYKSRYADLMNTVFSCENILSYLDTVVNIIAPEMTRHAARWGGSYDDWQKNVARLRYFIERRCEATFDGLADCHSLTGPYETTFTSDPAGIGVLKVNSLDVNQLPWSAKYFGGLDLNVQAASANPQYNFKQWSADGGSGIANASNAATTISLSADETITAHFLTTAVGDPSEITAPKLSVWPTVTSGDLTIQFELPEAMPVSLKLISATGAEVSDLLPANPSQGAGRYVSEINLGNSKLSEGVYFLQFTAGESRQAVKVVYQK